MNVKKSLQQIDAMDNFKSMATEHRVPIDLRQTLVLFKTVISLLHESAPRFKPVPAKPTSATLLQSLDHHKQILDGP